MAGSTPIYGFPYPESSDLVANYPALGQDLAEDIEGVIAAIPPGGLSMVNPTSIANSGGSASATGGQVTFTGVTSVSINGVFTSLHKNYKVLINMKAGSSYADYMACRYRASGTDESSSNYYTQRFSVNSTTLTGTRHTGETFARISMASSDNEYLAECLIQNPQSANITTTYCGLITSDGSAVVTAPTLYHNGTTLNNSSVYDGFTLFLNGSVSFSGSVRVYGYKNS